jgi:hypothetical protein
MPHWNNETDLAPSAAAADASVHCARHDPAIDRLMASLVVPRRGTKRKCETVTNNYNSNEIEIKLAMFDINS